MRRALTTIIGGITLVVATGVTEASHEPGHRATIPGAEFAKLPETAQLMYLHGAWEALNLFVTCPTMAYREALYGTLRLVKEKPDQAVLVTFFVGYLLEERGCQLRKGVYSDAESER